MSTPHPTEEDLARARTRADLIDQGIIPVLNDDGRIDQRYLDTSDVPTLSADDIGSRVCELDDHGKVPLERLPDLTAATGTDFAPAVDALNETVTELTAIVRQLTARTVVLEQALAANVPAPVPTTQEITNG